MLKNFCLLIVFILLNGCFGSVAFLGSASTTAASSASGNLARGAFTSAVSLGMKRETGLLPAEHVMKELKEEIDKKNKKKIYPKETELNLSVKDKAVIKFKEFKENKKKITKTSKIEDLAKKSVIYNRR